MKQPTAPVLENTIYPMLEEEEDAGQNYRLQKISEIEKTLKEERDTRKTLYKRYKRGINIMDGIDTALISISIAMASVGFAVPVLLPLEIAAACCAGLGVCVTIIRRRLNTKTKKHSEIKTIAESKLNSIKKRYF